MLPADVTIVAALLQRRVSPVGRNVTVVVSGGNVVLAVLTEVAQARRDNPI